MRVNTRLLILIGASLLALVLLAAASLFATRTTLQDEKREQITLLLKMAENTLGYYAKQEAAGKLTRQQAQDAARKSLKALKVDDIYFFARDNENRLVLHPKAEREGKVDMGSPVPDGRTTVALYKEALSKEHYGIVTILTTRAGSQDSLPKLNGVVRFDPWGWTVGTGFFIDDIDKLFWREATLLLVLGGVATALLAALGLTMSRSIVRSLGGEPAYAAEVVRRIAAGDLAGEITVNGPQGSLLAAMRDMREKLREMIAGIHAATADIGVASRELSQQIARVDEVSGVASNSTASAAAAIEQLSVSIDHVKDNTRGTEDGARRSSEMAHAGEQVAREAANGIEAVAGQVEDVAGLVSTLAERTRNISGIAETIRDIANQTNLLALNAAIEAARAGEMGRGFAVVADEVRKLAERTASATSEIGAIVQVVVDDTGSVATRMQDIRPAVEQGVAHANAAAHTLDNLNRQAHAALDNLHGVVSAMTEQSQAGTSIAASVEQVAGVVEETQSSVKVAVEAVLRIDSYAERLNASVSRFRL
ncbi:methyl-accepting chemotaxis protein [uncultured Aquitalea sp.]|uniref:methyl-accepting chemotaxis protein n=1 Tax=uncultured Aquitalea sp. TaxID=540272 RepID=UPI0025D3FC31|nr:methyl-accepting chemotaxis protein [uncultured Aquitalea sp.]